MIASTLVRGSLGDLAQRGGISIAESFLSADAIVVVDISGSMESEDGRGGQSRYAVACQELATLQERNPGKVAVVAFSDRAQFVPGGRPPSVGTLGAGTDMAEALRFVKVADGLVGIVLVSDGEPNDESGTLTVARGFKSRISTIFVGPEGGYGQEFLRRLAKASGGQSVTADRASELAAAAQPLILPA